jgi:heme-degrading monooxygenase HmoA
MVGSLLVIEFASRADAEQWLAAEPFACAGLYGETRIQAFSNLWPQQAGYAPSVRHMVMWNVRGDTPGQRETNLARLRTSFESLRGRVPGLLRVEVGLDTSRTDYACDVALISEFESQAALDAYAMHPEHLRVKRELGDMRIARHQVDYAVPADPKAHRSRP